MNSFISAVFLAVLTVNAAPLVPVAPIAGSTVANTNAGAFDNGAVSNVSPFGSNSNTWNNGFNAHQDAAANPWGNAGSSSFNNWNNNAWRNDINPYPYPMFW